MSTSVRTSGLPSLTAAMLFLALPTGSSAVGPLFGADLDAAVRQGPERFDLDATVAAGQQAPVVQPWRRVALDPAYAGAWVVAGDLDGDGLAEIVSARNVDRQDVHHTSAVVAQRSDGKVLWRWGDPNVGRKKLHHDVACQIYDWDEDGRNEVVLATEGFLVSLDGATGQERHRFPLPKDATDCVVFANLSGGPQATDVIVKTRYTRIWAFNRNGKQLWTVEKPGGHLTAHQPVPIDLDRDGRDEILAGYALLNSDGSTRWTVSGAKADLTRGHCDGFRLMRSGQKPEEFRFAMTFCGANLLAVLDGNGRILWELSGQHFESVDVGRICPDVSGLHLAVDIDHRPWGQGPLWVIDEQGRFLGRIRTDYARHHALLDWTGDGMDDILIAEARGIFDGQGRRVASLAMQEADLTDPRAADAAEKLALVGDMTGDGVPDVMLTTAASSAVYIYKNEHGRKPNPPSPPGTGVNFTLY